ncbi:MAG TPA: AAA family ATPase, partial [Bacillota bacterium]|nr:AAA family ATPase [Bacillota bacterium]
MLKHLSIAHYAIIDQLELDFHEGMTVLTGETGAGKSIILNSLNLI